VTTGKGTTFSRAASAHYRDPASAAEDVLMAGQALRHHMTLVTANVVEFSRVKGLRWQDWARR